MTLANQCLFYILLSLAYTGHAVGKGNIRRRELVWNLCQQSEQNPNSLMYQLPGCFTDPGCLQGPVIAKQVGSVSFNAAC